MGLKSVGKAKHTTTVVLVHPLTGDTLRNDDGSPMTVLVHGPYSPRYKAISHEQQNRRMEALRKSGGKMTLTAEQIEESALAILVGSIEDWDITLDKDPEPFSPETAKVVLTDYPWVREQIDSTISDTINFLDKPEKG